MILVNKNGKLPKINTQKNTLRNKKFSYVQNRCMFSVITSLTNFRAHKIAYGDNSSLAIAASKAKKVISDGKLFSDNSKLNIISEDTKKVICAVSTSIEAFTIINSKAQENSNNEDCDFLHITNSFFNAVKTLETIVKYVDKNQSHIDVLTAIFLESSKKVSESNDEEIRQILEKNLEIYENEKYSLYISKAKQFILCAGLLSASCICIYAYFKSNKNSVGDLNSINNSEIVKFDSNINNNPNILKSESHLNIDSPLGSVRYENKKYSILVPTARYFIKFIKDLFI